MRFLVQGWDKGSKSWSAFTTRTSDMTLAKALATVRDKVERRSQSMRIISGSRRMPRKLVTIKCGDNKEIAITFTPEGLGMYRAEMGDRTKKGYLEGLERGKGIANVESAGHRQVALDVADSRQIAIRNYKHYLAKTSRLERWCGNIPRIYRCAGCRLYFATPGTRHSNKCRYCGSTKTRRARL